MEFTSLEILYQAVLFEHRLTTIVAKIGLASLAIAIWRGNRQPGPTLLTVTLGFQLLISGYVTASGPSFMQGEAASAGVVPGVISAVAGIGLLASLLDRSSSWSLSDVPQPRALIGWVLLLWAFVCPLFWRDFASGDGEFGRAILYAPIGVLPGSTLLSGVALAFLGQGRPRTASFVLGGGALLVGGWEALHGVATSALTAAAGIWVLFEAFRAARRTSAEGDAPEDQKKAPAATWRKKSDVLPEDLFDKPQSKPRQKPTAERPARQKSSPQLRDDKGGRWKLK